MTQLKETAKQIYFETVLNDKYRENFLQELPNRTVVDKREQGYYCSYCNRFSSVGQMNPRTMVIFPNTSDEIWIVVAHYDGCRGWD